MRNLPSLWSEFDRPFLANSTWRSLLQQLDDFVNETAGSSRTFENTQTLVPAVDVEETESHFVLNFDMPGLDKDNIDISVLGNQLTVTAERKYENKQGEGRSRFVERRYGKFQRMIALPDGVKPEQVEAQYQNGVLTVALPRAMESKRQKIKIGDGKTGFLSKMLGNGSKKEKEAINVKTNDQSEGARAH